MMATKDLDDMVPRPLPKPSQLEEQCTKPEVPEVSLVFDYPLQNSLKYNTIPCHQKEPIQQEMTSTSMEKNLNLPAKFFEHGYSVPSSAKTSNHPSYPSAFLKTPNNLDDHNFSNMKKVSFSPIVASNGSHTPERKSSESTQSQRQENISYECNDSVAISPHNHYTQRFTSDSKKASCSCASCFESCDLSLDHNANCGRILKNVERKINTKVSFDDLQKTELKIENILLKHKCKYDKLGENCVTKEEFNRVMQKYENQVNMLQFRLEELTQKFNYMSQHMSTPYNREFKKCTCSESQNYHISNSSKEPKSSGFTYSSPNCCSHYGPKVNVRCNHHEVNRNNENEVATIAHDDRIIQKETRVDLQIAAQDKEMTKKKICRERCCNVENMNCVPYSQPVSCVNDVSESRGGCPPQMLEYNRNFPKQYRNEQRHVPTPSPNEPVHNQAQENTSPSSFPHVHRKSQEIDNDNQLQQSSDKNVLLDWTFYNNIVENVKNVIQQSPTDVTRDGDTVDLIKKATIEQLQKMGINVNNVPSECYPDNDKCQKNKFNAGNLAPSPDLSFRMNSLAMKYVSEIPSDGDTYNKKSGTNDISFRSNGNNVSIATLQYMERYQLLPNTEHRNGGNPVSHNKYEPTISQEHHHKLYKQTQNNDRSFIR